MVGDAKRYGAFVGVLATKPLSAVDCCWQKTETLWCSGCATLKVLDGETHLGKESMLILGGSFSVIAMGVTG